MDSEKTSKEATGIRNAPEKLGLGGRLSFLAKDSMIYGGARALMQALSFITFPIMVRHFDVAQYGIIDFYGICIGCWNWPPWECQRTVPSDCYDYSNSVQCDGP